jgi:outer membrane immunogenic protein
MRKLVTRSVAAAYALFATAALGADLPPPAAAPVYRPLPPVVVPLFTWTGCYVGGNAGGLWAGSDWNDGVFGDFGSGTASGAVGGAQIGCNYQAGSWVFGIQGDYDWTSANNNNNNAFLSNLTGLVVTDQTQINSLASVTGRVGYAWDRFLAYVKGGGAWVKASYQFQIGGVAVATDSATQGGWTVGLGGEYAFTNWLTGFVEYDYYGFSDTSPGGLVCAVAAGGCAGGVLFTNNVSITNHISVVKAGLNLKFGPGVGF